MQMAFFTLRLTESDVVEMIDQRKLPLEVSYVELTNYKDVYDAIKNMIVRGAPAIGVSAAFGLYLASKSLSQSVRDFDAFKSEFFKICDFMFSARPTAVNLGWAIERIKSLVIKGNGKTVNEMVKDIRAESLRIFKEDVEINKNMGIYGAKLLKDGFRVLTHCNAGALATAGYGTALGVIRAAVENNKRISVISDETRPFLQGARLTTWELMEDNIPVTLIADNSAGLLMRKGKIDAVIVGADRIASNGDVANKIGTYQVAVLAKENNVPFYVAAPLSTMDLTLESGDEIPVEERDASEVVNVFGKRIAPNGVKALNYAFDITPNKYVGAIITEKGVLYPPYKKSIAEAFGK
ncbi:MAG: S-methyl-5-thioribose-1-phosphate isomerase [Deltaproteobacteria bacterium]|nr:S-methyl-5-thioribose-1-phosphate isomerase [Deltaproteobacteria bacterium]